MPELFRSDASEPDATDRCPRCGAAPVNVQGLADCPACTWTDSVGRR